MDSDTVINNQPSYDYYVVFVLVTGSLYAVLAILEVTMYIQGWP